MKFVRSLIVYPQTLWLAILHGSVTLALAQDGSRPALAPTEALCGYGQRFVAVTSTSTKVGLSVRMVADDPMVGQTVPLRFRVQRSPGEVPVDDLQVEHEKLMHVIGVRDDLGEFFHIHPERGASGWWQVIHTFTNGGRYHVWADVKRLGTVYSFAQSPLIVSGRMKPATERIVPRLHDSTDGYQIQLAPAGDLELGKTNRLEIVVRDATGKQVGLEFYLGAMMHLVLVKDDLSVYLHGHAENHDKSQPTVVFHQMFPQPGNYKLFAQFRPMKSKLPPDAALLAEFWVNVAKTK